MSTHTYSRALVGSLWDVDVPVLAQEIRDALAPVHIRAPAGRLDQIEITATPDLTPMQVLTLDNLVSVHQGRHSERSLAALKQERADTIDRRTRDLIQTGFNFSGVDFSLADRDFLQLESLDRTRLEGVTYPLTWSGVTDTLLFQDADEIHTFFLAARDARQAHVESGNALKRQIHQAANRAEVLSVVDTR